MGPLPLADINGRHLAHAEFFLERNARSNEETESRSNPLGAIRTFVPPPFHQGTMRGS